MSFNNICKDLEKMYTKKNKDYGEAWKHLGLLCPFVDIFGKAYRLKSVLYDKTVLNFPDFVCSYLPITFHSFIWIYFLYSGPGV